MIVFWIILILLIWGICFCEGVRLGARGWEVSTRREQSMLPGWVLGLHIARVKIYPGAFTRMEYRFEILLGPWVFRLVFLVFKSPKLKEDK